MRILIAEHFHNGVGLAQRLCHESPEVEGVWLVTDSNHEVAGVWGEKFRGVTRFPVTVETLVQLARREKIDLVVNYNSVLGAAQLVEAMDKAGVPCIGSNFRLSTTELHKESFKDWMVANDFQTPATLFRGSFAEVHAKSADFPYPVVIKPARQEGPKVHVCQDRDSLLKYLTWTHAQVPHARMSVRYSIERHVPIQHKLVGAYFLCGGRAVLNVARRLPVRWSAPPVRECALVTTRHPRNRRFKPELTRFAEAVSGFSPAARASVECALTPEGGVYILETNARPGGRDAAFGAFADPLEGLRALHRQDHAALATRLKEIDDGVEFGISLHHPEPEIPVDYDTLKSLPGFQYFPVSVEKRADAYVSRKVPIPSFLMLEAATPDAAFDRIREALPTIQRTGRYLPIRLESVSAELFDP